MGVYARATKNGTTYWISYQLDGEQVRARAGTDRREAERMLARIKRSIRDGTYGKDPDLGVRLTLDRFAERYFRERKTRSVASEQSWYRRRIAPEFGRRELHTLTPQEIAAWLERLRTDENLSASSVRNVHAVLSGMLQRATFEGHVSHNPARGLPRGMLPKARKRGAEPYSREELGVMLGAPEVADDERILVALMGLSGMRLGEACGRRWRDLDTAGEPLWMLHVHDQYDGQPLKSAEDDHDHARWVPVHPLLRELLKDWFRGGFERIYGRAPRDDDFVTPHPASMGSRSVRQAGSAVDRVIEAAGVPRLPGRRAHSLRRSFISLARSDGARPDVLERVTHNSSGAVIDRYTWLGWDALCKAVSVLDVKTLLAMPEAVKPVANVGHAQETGRDRLAALRA